MKKLIVLLLAFAMVGAVSAQAAAPAPALKLSGALYGGVQYESDTDVVSFARWYGGSLNAFRVRVNGSYSNDTIGAAFRLQTNVPGTAPTYARAFGWAKFFGGKLTANVGKLGDYTFASTYNSFGAFDGTEGMELIVAPVAGLKIGAILPVAVAGGKTLAKTFQDMAFGAAYSIKDVADITATVDLSDTAKPTVTGFVNVKAVKNLTAYIEYKGTLVGDAAGNNYIFEYAYYNMDKLTVGVMADQKLYNNGTTAADISISPDVAYDITDAFNAGVSATIGLGGLAGDWSVGPYATLAIKNGEFGFGAGYDQDSTASVYTMWTFNF